MPVVQSHAMLSEKLKQYRLEQQQTDGLLIRDHGGPADSETAAPDLQSLVATICSQILQTDAATVAGVAARQMPRQVLLDLIARTAEQISVRAGFFRRDLQQQVMDFLFGYGPLQPYVSDEAITDIDGTGPASFTVMAGGVRRALQLAFPDENAYDTFCRLLIIRNGGIINENDSHCRVTDDQYRLRINVTVPPRSIRYPSVSIRKHSRKSLRLDDLTGLGMMTGKMADQLKQWAFSDRTVLFCGKGAAGKTTLMRAFIEEMPPLERVLIAESDCELYPEKPCCLQQRIKKPYEGGRPVNLLDLIRDGLTMSLDTYCVGEIVGDEAMAFIHAAFSGHRCLATIHAECATDVPDRLLALARPVSRGEADETLRRMIGRSIDLIICLRAFRICEIQVVRGYREEDGRYDLACLWTSRQDSQTDPSAAERHESLVPGA